MTIDYDVPRVAEADADSDSGVYDLKALTVRRGEAATRIRDDLGLVDDEALDLPGSGTINEELVAVVVPRRLDEFTCGGCFLVQHKSRAVRQAGVGMLCPDCA